jgi:hypothetical protein
VKANTEGGQERDADNPSGSERGLATWGSSALALDWTGRTF